MPSLIFGEHPVVAFAALLGIVGAINGHLLWKRGRIVLSTIPCSGLVLAGTVAFLGTQTIGGSTGILYLASVITAGGFLGLLGALSDMIAVFASGILIIFFGDVLRPMVGLSSEPFIPRSILYSSLCF